MTDQPSIHVDRIKGFSEGTWQAMVRAGKLRRVSEGEVLLKQGDVDDRLIIVLAGEVSLHRHNQEGTFRVGIFKSAGDALSHPSMHLKTRKFFSFVAEAENTIVLEITRDTVYDLCQAHRDFLEWVTRELSLQVMITLEQLRQDRELSAESRIARRLSDLASRDGSIRLTQAELGKHLGISRVTVSKCLSQLEDAGIVLRRYGSIDIVNRDALNEWIGRQ